MPEAYMCLCGCQDFLIYNNFISCSKCGKEYRLKKFKRLDGTETSILEKPKDFNERIRKEA